MVNSPAAVLEVERLLEDVVAGFDEDDDDETTTEEELGFTEDELESFVEELDGLTEEELDILVDELEIFVDELEVFTDEGVTETKPNGDICCPFDSPACIVAYTQNTQVHYYGAAH